MIGLDTNVLVRYVVRDDADQAELADSLIDSLTADEPGFVPLVVLVECWWVLGRAYSFPVVKRREFVEALLTSQELRVERTETVRAAIFRTRGGADFADALVAVTAEEAGCTVTMTFDHRAATQAGMELLTL